MSPVDWATALADVIGHLLAADSTVPDTAINEIAASVGDLIAAIAHAERKATKGGL
jgi:hypothetical protein